MTIVTDEPEPASLESQLGSQRGDRYDLALDDGTYFACEIAFERPCWRFGVEPKHPDWRPPI